MIRFENEEHALVWKYPAKKYEYGTELQVRSGQAALFMAGDGGSIALEKGHHLLSPELFVSEEEEGGESAISPFFLDPLFPGRVAAAHRGEGGERLPLIGKLSENKETKSGPFEGRLYYIYTDPVIGIKWGTVPKMRITDPKTQLKLDIGARGSFTLRILDPEASLKKMLQIFGSSNLDFEVGGGSEFGKDYLRSLMKRFGSESMLEAVDEFFEDSDLGVMEMENHQGEIFRGMIRKMNRSLREYGLQIIECREHSFFFPEDDKNYRQLKQQYADRALWRHGQRLHEEQEDANSRDKIQRAQTNAEIRVIESTGEAEAKLIAAEAEARAKQLINQADRYDISGYGKKMAPVWQCVCGKKGNTGKFCGKCGEPRVDSIDPWICENCYRKNTTGTSCSFCGSPKPAVRRSFWTCTRCGRENNMDTFCDECGRRRPEEFPG